MSQRHIADTKTIILLELARGSGHGMSIITRVSRRTNGQVVLAQGTAYPILWQLESDGLIRFVGLEHNGRRGREGRLYEITTSGMETARGYDALLRMLLLPA